MYIEKEDQLLMLFQTIMYGKDINKWLQHSGAAMGQCGMVSGHQIFLEVLKDTFSKRFIS